MFVKPHPDKTVRVHLHGQPDPSDVPLQVLHPHTRTPIPHEGMAVPEDVYWMRRLRDGDVIKAEPPAPVSEVAAERSLPAPEAEPSHTEAERGA